MADKIKAIVLAAGYATRLYPLTLNIPKPLLQITKDKAVIDFIIDDLESSRLVDEIIVVTNDKFYGSFREWAKRRKKGITLSVLNDGTRSNDDRLGAIGDIYFAVKKKKIASDFLVVGGDNLFDRGFGNFLKFALTKKPLPSLGLFDIKDKAAAHRFGIVSIDGHSKVTSFEEKPSRPKTTLVATCLYFLPGSTLALLEDYISDRNTSKDAPGNYIRWLTKEGEVFGFVLKKGHWYDIGHFDSYREVVARFNKA